MPVSFANVQTPNMELSPCRITFNGVDLGGSLSNVKVNMEYDKAEIKADQFGTTVLDRRVSGLKISVETELAETQNKDIWKVVFPHAYEVATGTKSMYFTSQVGDADLTHAFNLVLHPLSKQDADLSGNVLFYKAVADAKSSLVFGPTEQQKLKIVWNVLPDTGVVPARFALFGDPTIGIVNASAAAAVAGGGNVGNGTVSAISVNNGFTKTETITLLCIHAATNAGIFQVTGSVSGFLGNATVGVNFVSNPISFLVNDGSTDFSAGDTFTIATTAANYS